MRQNPNLAIRYNGCYRRGRVDIVKGNMGWIEVVVGPMFSGKSEELIRRLRRGEIGKQRGQSFKPHIYQRHSQNGERETRLSPSRACVLWLKKSPSCLRFACVAGIRRYTRNGWLRRKN